MGLPADADALFDRIRAAVVDEPVPCTCADEEKCAQGITGAIRDAVIAVQTRDVVVGIVEQLDGLVERAEAMFKKFPHRDVPACWLSLHTDASILRSACELLLSEAETQTWERTVARLDRAIIISGAAGYDRLELIYDLIELVHKLHLPLDDDPFADDPSPESLPFGELPPHSQSIPRLSSPPSLAAFTTRLSSEPFILPGFLSTWPALNEHPWKLRSYLLRAAGRARVVPVELGADYTRDDWGQMLMPWEDFLRSLSATQQDEVRYLAQHDLLKQFPALRDDIVVPDYVYADVPGARDTLLLNAWVGRAGAGSPAHFDEFANCYCVVTGRRIAWLAPPSTGRAMDAEGNTARVDVFAVQQQQQSEAFAQGVLPHALAAVLEAGDMLYIPRGWWHAFRIVETSFAVSMWF